MANLPGPLKGRQGAADFQSHRLSRRAVQKQSVHAFEAQPSQARIERRGNVARRKIGRHIGFAPARHGIPCPAETSEQRLQDRLERP